MDEMALVIGEKIRLDTCFALNDGSHVSKNYFSALRASVWSKNKGSRCIHKMCSYKDVPGYIRSGAPLWTQKQHIFGQ